MNLRLSLQSLFVFLLCLVCLPCGFAYSADDSAALSRSAYSPSATGFLGLNTVPSARMDETGSVRAGISSLQPYIHAFMGMQIAAPLYIGVRQTAEANDIFDTAERFYPGLDFKLRLQEETRARPAVVVGVQSAFGHKRMAGEYIAASKRFGNWDFTGGLGWGRYGSAGHFGNPLKILSSHFGGRRDEDGQNANDMEDWFTGDDVGLFAGAEYLTSIKGLSLKFDYGADEYAAEKRSVPGFDRPALWSAGLSYTPVPWMNAGLALQGTDRIMGRLSFRQNVASFRDMMADAPLRPPMSGFVGDDLASAGAMQVDANGHGQALYDVMIDGRSVSANLAIRPDIPVPFQIGRAAVDMMNNAGRDISAVSVTPTYLGLYGMGVRLMRGDVRRAEALHEGSATEIWNGAEFFVPERPAAEKLRRPAEEDALFSRFHTTLDNQLSLAEEDSGALYRSSLVAGLSAPRWFGFMDYGAALRINLGDNLHHLRDYRPRAVLPVRSDVDDFAKRRIALDTAYMAFTHSFSPDFHLSLISGYLEEMYAGAGGEVLYRPFGKRFALGAEAFQSFKRDPLSGLNLGLNGDHVLSGHLKAWYDIPVHDLTVQAKIGRYLAEDFGGTLSLDKTFRNGVTLSGYVSLTDSADLDVFGGTTHLDNGIRLSIPLGGFKYVPDGTRTDFSVKPFGRDAAQSIKNPLPLYEATDGFSYPHMARHWQRILD